MSESRIVETLERDLAECYSILDVGCGYAAKYLSMIKRRPFMACLDAYPAYLEAATLDCWKINGRAEDRLPTMESDFVDGVMALDFIEHLEKPTAIQVIREMQRIARKKVVLFTPDGFHPQGPGLPNAARYSQQEWEFQTHRSAWDAADLAALGFVVEHWDFDYGKGEEASRALWGVWTR